MKLLFVGYLHGFGGAEKMLITLANAMAERGHNVDLVSLAANSPRYPISDNIKYTHIQETGRNKLALIKNRYIKLKEYINTIQPDLIINFWFQSAYFCAFMGKDIAQKTIYAERGDPYDKEYDGLLGIVRALSFKRIRGFVFQSGGARNCFGEAIKKRSCIIHNPVFIKPEDFTIPEQRDKRIVTIGRLHEQKNHELLIDAFATLPEDKSDYILEIYGEGKLREQLQKKINDMKLMNRVFLKGAFNDVHQRIAGAALFVLSSDYEGMPNALLEAMAIGLPCVATDCRPGGAREIIRNKINGEIVPVGNKQLLKDAIVTVLENQAVSERYSVNAKFAIEACQPNIIYSEWEQFFDHLRCQ